MTCDPDSPCECWSSLQSRCRWQVCWRWPGPNTDPRWTCLPAMERHTPSERISCVFAIKNNFEQQRPSNNASLNRTASRRCHLNFRWEALRYSLMGFRWALSPKNILLEAACCSILATDPRFRRCSVVSWPPADTSMMSKASGATMAGFM